ncbi:MAG: translation initiation factor IF-2 associated domain-containing protein, partial [Porticoccaceae bacterium]|nr:translation initiation factor IF-2 associated domain-containing protein [Porticoccaceae bacterium]
MAEVTVSELAETVGASVERLLAQMEQAGLSHKAGDASVSDEEKQTLLAYLKSLHGDQSSEPKKITLRRKSISTLKAGSGRKSVNVEVRKKRTYVKRDAGVPGSEVEQVETAAAEPVAAAGDNYQATLEDAESKRLASIAARRKLEEESKLATEEAALSNQAAAEEAPKEEPKKEPVTKLSTPVLPAAVTDDVSVRLGKKRDKSDDDPEDRPKKKKAVKGARKRRGGSLVDEADIDDDELKKPRLTS